MHSKHSKGIGRLPIRMRDFREHHVAFEMYSDDQPQLEPDRMLMPL